MDFTKYDPRALAEAGAKLFLVDPLGRKTGAFLELKGADSNTYQEAIDDIQRKRGAQMQKARKIKAPDPEEFRSDAYTVLAAVTCSWGNLGEVGYDSDVPCTPANAIELYRERPDIFEQADAFIGDRTSFLPSAATSSDSSRPDSSGSPNP